MKRLVFQKIRSWASSPNRKPAILRGARQVGKTHVVRQLGETFEHMVEINFERSPEYKSIFEKNLDPVRIIEMLSLKLGQPIIPGKTLLFLDEVQACPKAIAALRYFYEEMPDLHVIAAGSLLDFAIEKIGVPVGRVTFLYLYPLSFIEFLVASGKRLLAQKMLNHLPQEPFPELLHDELFCLLGEYMLTGGMPEVVHQWLEQRDLLLCNELHRSIITSYQQDFGKYCRTSQLKYIELIFDKIPSLICQQFKYTHLGTAYQKRELAPCLDLLVRANVISRIMYTSGQGVPLGATVNFEKFKLLFIDIALCQTMLGLSLKDWILEPIPNFVNKEALCEALVGQELQAYTECDIKANLYYWHRDKRGSLAEVDYIISKQQEVVPIEVKAGKGSALHSIRYFLENHKHSPYGVRFSTQNYSAYEHIHSYPLYAVAALYAQDEQLQRFVADS